MRLLFFENAQSTPQFSRIFFLPSCPIRSPSVKFSKKPHTTSRNFQFSIRLKSSSCALNAIESNPTGHWAFGDAQNLPVRLQDGFQKTPSKLLSPNRPNSTPGNSWINPDSHVWNSLVDVYIKCWSSKYACKVFGEIPDEILCPVAGKPS